MQQSHNKWLSADLHDVTTGDIIHFGCYLSLGVSSKHEKQSNAGLMFVHRRRLWLSINPLLVQHEMLTQCWYNVGPSSAALAQHCTYIGQAPRVCWGPGPLRALRGLSAIVRCHAISPIDRCVSYTQIGIRAKGETSTDFKTLNP